MPTSEVESLKRRLIQIGVNIDNYKTQLDQTRASMRDVGVRTPTGASKVIKKNKATIKRNNIKISDLLDRAEDIMEESGL